MDIKRLFKGLLTADNIYTQIIDALTAVSSLALAIALTITKNPALVSVIPSIAAARLVLNLFFIRIGEPEAPPMKDESIIKAAGSVAKDFVIDQVIEFASVAALVLFFIGSIRAGEGLFASLLFTAGLFILNLLDVISKYVYIIVQYGRQVRDGLRNERDVTNDFQ